MIIRLACIYFYMSSCIHMDFMQGDIPASDKQIKASVLNIGPISNQMRSQKCVTSSTWQIASLDVVN